MIGSYLFGGDTQETPETIKRKRAIAQALLRGSTKAPESPAEAIGQGLSGLGDALLYRKMNSQADAAEKQGLASLEGDRAALFGGMGAGSAPLPVPGAAAELSSTSPAPAAGDGSYRNAIASIESAGSGDYAAVGPTHPKLGRAMGRYQIMEANIGPWSQEALGRAVTPEEFMADPKIQDAIFDKQFGKYVQQYGPEGAAQAWFAGPGGVGKLDRKDSLGTSVAAYSQKFNKAMGGAPAAIDAIAPPSGSVQPQFDAGRFGDQIKLAEMPAGPDDMGARLQTQATAYASAPSPVAAALMGGPQAPKPPSPVAAALMGSPGVSEMQTVSGPAVAPAGGSRVAQALSGKDYYPAAPNAPGQTGPSLQQAFRVLNHPFASASDKALALGIVQKAQKENDPETQLRRQYLKAQTEALEAKAAKSANGGDDEWGLNPVWGKDKDGRTVLGQVSKSGKFKPLDTGEFQPTPGISNIDTGTTIITRDNRTGQTISTTPKDNRQEAAEIAEGKADAEFRKAFPQIESDANQMLGSIDSLIGDPYLDSMVGSVQGKWLPNVTSDAARVQSKMDQIGGQSFLQAYNALRGGGQITEVEGQKATAAMGRLNTAQSEADYRQALNELRSIVQTGLDRARQRMGGGAQMPASAPTITAPVKIGGYTIEAE